MKTSELTGALLDYWVARSENLASEIVGERGNPNDEFCTADKRPFMPSTDWAQCGPLIEKHRFTLCAAPEGKWTIPHVGFAMYGATPQEAICRAVVRAAFGDEVEEVPVCE